MIWSGVVSGVYPISLVMVSGDDVTPTIMMVSGEYNGWYNTNIHTQFMLLCVLFTTQSKQNITHVANGLRIPSKYNRNQNILIMSRVIKLTFYIYTPQTTYIRDK